MLISYKDVRDSSVLVCKNTSVLEQEESENVDFKRIPIAKVAQPPSGAGGVEWHGRKSCFI